MNRHLVAAFFLALCAFALTAIAEEAQPQMPSPQKEHEWLQQLAGEWDAESKFYMEPGAPPMEGKWTETVRSLNGFWIIAESVGTIMESEYKSILTVGFDPETGKYIGTWVDGFSSLLWKYTGSVDESGKVLTLEAEGPCPRRPGTITKFKDVIEIKGKNKKTFTSHFQDENGEWVKMMGAEYKRRK